MRFILMTTATPSRAAADTGRGAIAEPVAEIVTFRLLPGADAVAFAAAAEGMTPFLQDTQAMVARTLSQDDTGLWTDHLVWTSRDAAQSAAARIMAEPDATPFMQMIDPETVTMRHAPIRFSQKLE